MYFRSPVYSNLSVVKSGVWLQKYVEKNSILFILSVYPITYTTYLLSPLGVEPYSSGPTSLVPLGDRLLLLMGLVVPHARNRKMVTRVSQVAALDWGPIQQVSVESSTLHAHKLHRQRILTSGRG